MYEIWTQVLEQLHGIWRFRWRALLVAWLVAVPGWIWVYTLPNIYSASARVYVDTDSALRPLLKGLAVESNVLSQVQMMTRALLSRPHLEKVARETDLDLRATNPTEMESVLDRLRRKIQITSDRSQIYTIDYEDPDREVAFAVVQTLLSSFVEDSLGANRVDSSNAQRFLEEQIREYEERLDLAEARLAKFKQDNVGRMPGAEGGYYERLQAALQELETYNSELGFARNRVDMLNRQIAGEEAVFGFVQSPASPGGVATSVDLQINNYEEQLRELQLRFTDKHPDVIAIKETLEVLYSQQSNERDAMGAITEGLPNPSDELAMNPVYQEMRIALTQSELDVTTLGAKVIDQRGRVARLRNEVDTIPEIEAEYKRLTRDYNVTREQYEKLSQRLELARVSEEAEQRSDDVKFRIIDPPLASVNPVAPNRQLFLTAVLLAGLGAGGALAFLNHQLTPVFSNRRSLAEVTGLPVLGTISLLQTPEEKSRVRTQTTAFAVMLLMLVCVWVLSVLFHERGVQAAQTLLAGGPL